MEDWTVRRAGTDDSAEIQKIYSHYVRNTAVTFEYDPPSIEEMAQRIQRVSQKYPYFVIEDEDGIKGFAFAYAFRGRPAYDYSAETTIYISPEARHKGYGKAVYSVLESALKEMGIKNLYACVAVPDGDDKHLNTDSPKFHKALGYSICGTFKNCGIKFGKWYTMVWTEKQIGEFADNPEPLIPYSDTVKNEEMLNNPLTFFDEKLVRLTTDSGVIFYGEATHFCAEYGLHSFGKEEEGLEVGVYVIYSSQIKSIKII